MYPGNRGTQNKFPCRVGWQMNPAVWTEFGTDSCIQKGGACLDQEIRSGSSQLHTFFPFHDGYLSGNVLRAESRYNSTRAKPWPAANNCSQLSISWDVSVPIDNVEPHALPARTKEQEDQDVTGHFTGVVSVKIWENKSRACSLITDADILRGTVGRKSHIWTTSGMDLLRDAWIGADSSQNLYLYADPT